MYVMEIAMAPGIVKLKKLLFQVGLAGVLLLLLTNLKAQEQEGLTVPVSLDVNNMPLHQVLSHIEQQTNYKFAYDAAIVLQQGNVTLKIDNTPLSILLASLLKETNLEYHVLDNQIILKEAERKAQVTISGYVKEYKSEELLDGTTIALPALQAGTISNKYGFYSITIAPTDSLALIVSYVGYKSITKKINARKSSTLNISLRRQEQQANHVVVTRDKREDNVKKNQVSAMELSADVIASAPSVNGNGDLVNTILQIPGVQAGLDGTPGYYVRGGNSDQNLIQLDEAVLYNPSHLFGLVSIFNTDAIRNAVLIKGGIPAAYGDHLSSVLDVSMKEGSNEQAGGSVQLGTVAAGLTFYSPIVKNKAAFMLSARRSTIDLLLRPFETGNYFSNYYFYDVNAKLNVQLSPKDRIFLSFYDGLDKGAYATDDSDGDTDNENDSDINYGIHFGNRAYALRWNHTYSGKLFSNTSLVYNKYYQSVSAIQQSYFAQLYSGISNLNIKTDFHYYPALNHRIRAGVDFMHQVLMPASVSDKIAPSGVITDINPGDIPQKHTNRFAFYLSDDIRLSKRLTGYFGVRVPVFNNRGTQYVNVEPRLSFLYLINPNTSIKIAGTQINQYLHLVQSYNASFPAEVWIGSSDVVKPQQSSQVSAGVFRNFKNNSYQLGIEGYYKQMANQHLFKGGMQPTVDSKIEERLIFGQGESYGAELFLRKNRGKLTGWLGYTYAHAYQQFDSLNFGQRFSTAHDRRHALNVAAGYAINSHWSITAQLFVTSGSAFTLKERTSPQPPDPDDNPLYDDDSDDDDDPEETSVDGTPNNYRLTPYNRLDLGLRYKNVREIAGRNVEVEWILSVYNVYAKENSSFAYRTIDPVTKQPTVREVSFIPVIPSITYSLRF